MPNQTFGHSSPHGFATRAIRAGQDPCTATGATIAPVYQTATFTLEKPGVTKGFDYSRSGNPTRSSLETQLASLEGARYASAFGSGMAAVAGITALLSSGDHIVATRDIYGGTHRLFTAILTRYGIETTFVDTSDADALRAAIRPNSRLLWLETPSNPLLKLTDIARAAAVAKSVDPRIVVAADNTFASPYFQRPLSQGADVVMHSTTKYLCGHSDVIGGVVISNDQEIAAQVAYHQNAVGAVPGPWDAYLTLRGVKTLALRMQAHARNAQLVAEFLAQRDDVAEVYYPGLASHPDHELAKRQMDGFGGVVSFRPRGGVDRAHTFAAETKLFNLATSLGGVESLLCIPAKMTHGSLTPEERLDLGVTDDLIRLSVGIEESEDLLADLGDALERSAVYSGSIS
jgi:cystathionine beta-lyase/cystathionine gamma-synthase